MGGIDPVFVVSRTLEVFPFARPDSLPPRPCLGFHLSILVLQVSEFSSTLGLIHRCHASFQHFKSNIPSKQPAPYKHRSNDSVVLIAFVYVSSDPAVQYVVSQPCQCFCSKWLRLIAKMCTLWRVNTCYSNSDLVQGNHQQVHTIRGSTSYSSVFQIPLLLWYFPAQKPTPTCKPASWGVVKMEVVAITNSCDDPKQAPPSEKVRSYTGSPRDAMEI